MLLQEAKAEFDEDNCKHTMPFAKITEEKR